MILEIDHSILDNFEMILQFHYSFRSYLVNAWTDLTVQDCFTRYWKEIPVLKCFKLNALPVLVLRQVYVGLVFSNFFGFIFLIVFLIDFWSIFGRFLDHFGADFWSCLGLLWGSKN